MDVADNKTVLFEFIHNISNAGALVVFWDAKNNFGDNIPTELLVDFLSSGCLNADMNAIQNFIVKIELV